MVDFIIVGNEIRQNILNKLIHVLCLGEDKDNLRQQYDDDSISHHHLLSEIKKAGISLSHMIFFSMHNNCVSMLQPQKYALFHKPPNFGTAKTKKCLHIIC